MTTFAYRDGVLAVDSSSALDNTILPGLRKSTKGKNGTLAAGCGTAAFVARFLSWVEGGEKPNGHPEPEDNDTAALFRRSGLIMILDTSGWFDLRPPYYASGSGRDLAIGAMFAGADAETAVRAAVAHDAFTNGEIFVLEHKVRRKR